MKLWVGWEITWGKKTIYTPHTTVKDGDSILSSIRSHLTTDLAVDWYKDANGPAVIKDTTSIIDGLRRMVWAEVKVDNGI